MGRSVVLSPMGYLERVVQAARGGSRRGGCPRGSYRGGLPGRALRFHCRQWRERRERLAPVRGPQGTLSDFQRQKRLKVLSLTDNTPTSSPGQRYQLRARLRRATPQPGRAGRPPHRHLRFREQPNILRAVEYANRLGLHTFGVTGFDGGRLREIAHACLHVPCDDMGVVEAIHAIFFHYLVDALRLRFQGEAGA